MSFSLEKFEYHAYNREHEPAARALFSLLQALDSNYGSTGQGFTACITNAVLPDETDTHLWTRVASAITCLFSDPSFQLSSIGYAQMLHWHAWFSGIFSASPFRNADHLLRALNAKGQGEIKRVSVSEEDLVKFCLLYTVESEIVLSMDTIWNHNKALALGLGLVLLSSRFLGAEAAHDKREKLLPWLAKRLPEIDSIESLPASILHSVYMHCSYADRPDRHDIKGAINVLIQRWLARVGIESLSTPTVVANGTEKPVMLVVVEWFSASHSIYRTHSRTLEAAREQFHIVGMGLDSAVDAVGIAVFDEFIVIEQRSIEAQIRQVRDVAEARQVQVFYMPSVGMFQLTMYLTNLRLAPLQAMALGHPATTHSQYMDYVIVEQDYVGDPACFSETLLVLPKDGMPYRPSASVRDFQFNPVYREDPDVVHVAVASSTMKFNPEFLGALARIAEETQTPVRFHFLVLHAQGIIYPQVQRVVRKALGDSAVVYPHQPYSTYMQLIAACDMFLNPFPFGNTNGIVDTVTAGLVGVCKTGREVFEHIDEGLFGRLGFPAWLVAKTHDEYVSAAVRLIDNHVARNQLRQSLAGPYAVEKLFVGRPEIMGKMLACALSSVELS